MIISLSRLVRYLIEATCHVLCLRYRYRSILFIRLSGPKHWFRSQSHSTYASIVSICRLWKLLLRTSVSLLIIIWVLFYGVLFIMSDYIIALYFYVLDGVSLFVFLSMSVFDSFCVQFNIAQSSLAVDENIGIYASSKRRYLLVYAYITVNFLMLFPGVCINQNCVAALSLLFLVSKF